MHVNAFKAKILLSCKTVKLADKLNKTFKADSKHSNTGNTLISK